MIENYENWRNEILEILRSDAKDESNEVVKKESTDDRLEILSFKIGDEFFGIDIKSVSEIIRPRSLTPLPRSPDFVLGVVSLRGMIIPVIHTGIRIGICELAQNEFERIVVVKDGEECIGFAVDSIAGVVRFSAADLEKNELTTSIDSNNYLTGIGYDLRGKIVALVSPERLCDFTLERN